MLNDLSGLSNAVLSSRMDAEWSYDRNSGRYRDERGRFLSEKSVQTLVDGRIDRLDSSLRRFTRMLADGAITLDQWQGSVREAIKAAHLQAAIIGHGGRSGMGSAEYGRVGQRLRQEYAYLQGFARDLLDQRISGPMAAARIGLYAQSVRGSFWEGASIRKEQQGFGLMQRILDPSAQHCSDCVGYAARGVVSIGSVPLPGQRCACRARCRCTVRYFRHSLPRNFIQGSSHCVGFAPWN
jgi:hypothetical protein